MVSHRLCIILQAGKFIPVNDISDNETEVYRYPCCNGNGKRGFVERFNAWGAHPLIGHQGALCGNILKNSQSFCRMHPCLCRFFVGK